MDIEIIIGLSVVGLMLIAIDFYLPSFVLGTCGVLLMIVATVICGMHHSLTTTLVLVCAEIVAGFVAAWLSITYFPKTKYGQKLILNKTLEGAQSSQNASRDLVGCEGVAQTMLRPSGTALINGKRLDVLAESAMIAPGSTIRVVSVEGTNIVVRKIEAV
jgi:membrane-bound serine protease (ClpP class)